jgi:DNA-binding response OmpR family regulator
MMATKNSIYLEQKEPVVLIVDDTQIDIDILSFALSRERYRVAVAMNGIHALDMVGKISPDLVLLDIMMPEMDGFELCKILKESAETKDIPVIFLTVKDETEDIVRGYRYGAVDYVTKPFNSEELLARICTHLELKKKRDNEQELISMLTTTLKERERAEHALQQAHDNLERLVEERTAELLIKNRQLMDEIEERKRAEAALENKSQTLEEFNTALKVLLEQRERDKDELEEWVLSNVKNLIMPNVEKLNRLNTKTKSTPYLTLLETNLKDLTSSFSQRLSSRYLNLTTKEIQVANLIKDGKSSKDIAELIGISERTIDFHRKNIRKKLGLNNRKINLRASLLNIS